MTFRYITIDDACPGETILELTADWESLIAGTRVTPLYAGFNNLTGQHERTVIVLNTGEKITGSL